MSDLTKVEPLTNSRNLVENPSKFASQLEKNFWSLNLVLVAWQPTSGAQENNVQRISTSHVCFFHMEKELINKIVIFLPSFWCWESRQDFLEAFAALFLLRGSKLNEDQQGMSFPFVFQAFTLVAQGQSPTVVSKSLQHNVTCVI